MKPPLDQLVLSGLISEMDAEIALDFQRLRTHAARLINAPRLVQQRANPTSVGSQKRQGVGTLETTREKRLLMKWSALNKTVQTWGEDYFLLLEWSLTPTRMLEKQRLIQVAKILGPFLRDLGQLQRQGSPKCTDLSYRDQ
ncbi:MAG: hypothetical protein ACK5TR_08270 [Alphaproteobacteria bacterium]|nr:hypothetical protein [Alphaproteobacteria bacterium]